MIETTKEALSVLTTEQCRTLHRIYVDSTKDILVTKASWDLPEGYVYFIHTYTDGRKIHGGISADGDVST